MPENLWGYLTVALIFFVLGRMSADRGRLAARGGHTRDPRPSEPSPQAAAPPRPLELPTELDTEIRELLDHGNPIQAIKRYREETGVDLKTAKQAIDAYHEQLRRSGLI